MSSNPEHDRIRQVYAARTNEPAAGRYAWWRSDVLLFDSSRTRQLAQLLREFAGTTLAEAKILDVGCGNGALLRRLAEWGADPAGLTGVDLLEDRLQQARRLSPAQVTWHHGSIEALPSDQRFDLVTAFTVFSSILEDDLRAALAQQVWERLRPGGTVIVFDFRFDNPGNANVRRVSKGQLRSWWPEAGETTYRSLLLAPPVARRIAPLSFTAAMLLEAWLPPLRSHFLYAARKPLG